MQIVQKAQEITAHKMIADIAVERAHEVYEENAMRYNNWYRMEPDRNAYVRRVAPTLVEESRRALTRCLESDRLTVEQKNEIFEALLMDASIPGSQSRGKYEKIVI